jgi:hypothetical protein
LPEAITMWRGVSAIPGIGTTSKEAKDLIEMYLSLKPGDIYEDKGFQSHTLNFEKAKQFSKAGNKKIIIRAITNSSIEGIYTNARREHEITVQKGTKWKVAGTSQFDKHTTIITVIPT